MGHVSFKERLSLGPGLLPASGAGLKVLVSTSPLSLLPLGNLSFLVLQTIPV